MVPAAFRFCLGRLLSSPLIAFRFNFAILFKNSEITLFLVYLCLLIQSGIKSPVCPITLCFTVIGHRHFVNIIQQTCPIFFCHFQIRLPGSRQRQRSACITLFFNTCSACDLCLCTASVQSLFHIVKTEMRNFSFIVVLSLFPHLFCSQCSSNNLIIINKTFIVFSASPVRPANVENTVCPQKFRQCIVTGLPCSFFSIHI